jgi:hypothetical protein
MNDSRYAPPGADVSADKVASGLPPADRGRGMRRFFAVALMVGGLLGVGILAILMWNTGFPLLGINMFALFAALWLLLKR